MQYQSTDEVDVDLKVITLKQAREQSRPSRAGLAENTINYGIPFLDDAFLGIQQQDLIVFGARTGVGKTQIATEIAFNAAKQNKKVLMFALESTRTELADRKLFPLLYNELRRKMPNVTYSDWARGRVFEDTSDVSFGDWEENVRLMFRLDKFGKKELQKALLAQHHTTDLFIIDHLHYLDLESDKENQETKDILKTLRDLVLEIKKPVVMISHIRKASKYDSYPLPSLDDFHGSSDISKIATHAFTFGICDVQIKQQDPYIKMPTAIIKEVPGTVMKILKNRVDGSRVGETAMLMFDPKLRVYDQNYTPVRYDYKEELFKETEPKPWQHNAQTFWSSK